MEGQYKVIIPIGRFCGIIEQLQRLKLRSVCYPFDWMTSNLCLIGDCIETNFKNYFDVTPIKTTDNKSGITYIYKDYKNYSGTGFPHHDCTKPEVKEAFTRRIERWKQHLTSTILGKILFVHETFDFKISEIEKFISIIRKHYPNLNFHIVICHEFADPLILDEKNEYVKKSFSNDSYTVFKIHLKWLRQSVYPSHNKFYDTIFKNVFLI